MRAVTRVGVGLATPLALLVLWEVIGKTRGLPVYLPPPSAIGEALYEFTKSGEIFAQSGVSLFRAISGFLIGSAAGMVVGLIAGSIRALRDLVEPAIIILNPIPKVAFLPIFIVGFGLGHETKIAIIAFSSFFPVFVASLEGLLAVPKRLLWSARSMGAGPLRLFFRVSLPATLPAVFSGLRISLALSFIVLFAAELMGSNSGLGYIISVAESNLRFDLVLAAIAVIGFLGFAADRVMLTIRAKVLRGRGTGRNAGQ